MKYLLLFTSLIFLSIPTLNVYQRNVSLLSLIAWMGAIILCVLFLHKNPKNTSSGPLIDLRDMSLIVAIASIGVAFILLVENTPSHFHQDEFILAFASYTLPSLTHIDWFTGYPTDYLAHFPIPYFIMQKPFFFLFGPTVAAVRFSQLPFYALIIVFLYLLSRELFSRRIAVIATISYVFLAANVYFSSFALMSIQSTLYTVVGFYFFVRIIRYNISRDALALGVVWALCFLAYPGSYIIPPILIFLGIVEVLSQKSAPLAANFGRSLIIFLVILTPFLTYAGFVDNFLTQRINQVNLFSGSWSEVPKLRQDGVPIASIIKKQLIESFTSLILPNIGGTGGFNFGKQSLLDPSTTILLLIGIISLFRKYLRKRDRIYGYLSLLIMLPFIFGFIFTIHPPPFHRLSIIFPFFSILIAFGITYVAHMLSPRRYLKANILLVIVMGGYIYINLSHLIRMVREDTKLYPLDTLVLAEYIKKNVPEGSSIPIGSFPSFHLGRELLFRTTGKYEFVQDSERVLLQNYHGNVPFILLRASPAVTETLKRQFPEYHFLDTLSSVKLNDLIIFSPPYSKLNSQE